MGVCVSVSGYTCTGVGTHECGHMWRPVEGFRCSFLSLSIPLTQGLSLNPRHVFTWLGWKLANSSDPCVSALFGVGVVGEEDIPFYMGAGI